MKKHDQLTEWLRDKILNNPQEPPRDAWQQISESLDLEEGWENIGEELDVESVWQKVDQRLHLHEHLQFYENISLSLSALALVPLLLFFLLLPGGDIVSEKGREIAGKEFEISEKEDGAGELAELPTKSPLRSGEARNIAPDIEEEESKSAITPPQRSARELNPSSDGVHSPHSPIQKAAAAIPAESEKKNSFPKEIAEEQGEEFRADYRGLGRANGLAYIHEEDLSPSIAIPKWKHIVLSEREPSKSSVPKMMVGIGSAAKISWLINTKTLEAFQRETLTTAVPAVYKDFFFLYGFRLNPKTMLQADFYLFNWSGQKYREYRNGSYGEIENKLLYRSLGISAIKQGWQIGYGSNPLFPYYQAGLYGGWLQNAKEHAFAVSTDRTSEFSRFHFGLQLGYGHDWQVLGNLSVSYGIGARLDLLNVYSGTSAIPASFRRTRNASLDFKLSLKYLLGK